MKEQDKTPGVSLNEMEIRVQNNDCKDAHSTWKKNGWTEWEFQHISKLKIKKSKKSHRAEEYNNWIENYLSGFSIRLDEAEKQIRTQGNEMHPNRPANK